jgi:large subunit ribosomal protein L21
VGAPLVAGASVSAEVVRHGLGKKVLVFKKKRRKGYQVKKGHRQGYTELRITEISA